MSDGYEPDKHDWMAAGALVLVIGGHVAIIGLMAWLLPLSIFIAVAAFWFIALFMAGCGVGPLDLFKND